MGKTPKSAIATHYLWPDEVGADWGAIQRERVDQGLVLILDHTMRKDVASP